MEQTNLEQIKDLVLSSVHIGNSDYPIAILPKDVNIVSLEKHNQLITHAMKNTKSAILPHQNQQWKA